MSAPAQARKGHATTARLLLIVHMGDRIEQKAFRVHDRERVEEMAHELDGVMGVQDVRIDLVPDYRGKPRTTVWL